MTSKNPQKGLVAGGIAGAIEATIMYPTEMVKTQLQLFPKEFKGPLNCAVTILKTKGIFAFYTGLSTLVIGSMPKAGVRFYAFNVFKKHLSDEKGKMSGTKSMLAGLGAGIIEAIVAVTPMETIKTMFIHDMKSQNPKYKGLIQGVGLIVKEEGIKGVYKGLFPTMLKQGGNQAVRFSVYEQIKGYLLGNSKRDFSFYESIIAGGTAGGISVYATMPFDVVKTKMQGLESKNYKGSLDCLLKVVEKDGVLGLWKGTTPRLGRVFCSSSIIFTCVEQILKIFNNNLGWKD